MDFYADYFFEISAGHGSELPAWSTRVVFTSHVFSFVCRIQSTNFNLSRFGLENWETSTSPQTKSARSDLHVTRENATGFGSTSAKRQLAQILRSPQNSVNLESGQAKPLLQTAIVYSVI